MASPTPYVPNNTKVKPKKPKFPTGHWEEGEWIAHDEEATKIRKQLTNKAQKSLTAYVTLRKAEGDSVPTPEQPASPEPPQTSTQPAAPVGNPEVRRMANDYVQSAGVAQHLPEQGVASLQPEETRKKIADAYDAGVHSPNDPDVQRSYAALKHETKQQYEHALRNGMTFTPWGANSDPYKTSDEMMADVRDNKHLGFYQGGDMPADHPLAEIDPDHGLSYNDIFRAVHDLYGHSKAGYQFGPKGEENAWLAHRQMYSPAAQPALATETRGQNHWVNNGRHLRRPDGSIPKKGEEGWIHPNDRPFAEQKAFLLPEEYQRP